MQVVRTGMRIKTDADTKIGRERSGPTQTNTALLVWIRRDDSMNTIFPNPFLWVVNNDRPFKPKSIVWVNLGWNRGSL